MPNRTFMLGAAVLAAAAVVVASGAVLAGRDVRSSASRLDVPPVVASPAKPRRMCADVFQPGQVIDWPPAQAELGCLDPDGGIQIIGSLRCNDGRHLYSVEPATGAPRGWGYDRYAYHAALVNLPDDRDYAAAYMACIA